jgi:hypothetical protein
MRPRAFVLIAGEERRPTSPELLTKSSHAWAPMPSM